MIRNAGTGDGSALAALEQKCFETDRISARQFRYLLTRGHAATLVDEHQGNLRGYVLLLFRSGTSLARLYSIAVDTDTRGQGIGRHLLEAAEEEARQHGCVHMRAEISTGNHASIKLFQRLGYRQFGIHQNYYEDHRDALRFEKRLVRRADFRGLRVPFYRQTLDFTCGAASLMMAMKAVARDSPLDRGTEVRLWREATTVFMTSGHGGCGPYGLALAAHRRGFDTSVFVSDSLGLFVDSVRSEEKKAVMRLVEEEFLEEILEAGIPVHHERLTPDTIDAALRDGRVPVVLISSYRMYREKAPHWVVVTGTDASFFYIHDPFVAEDKGRTETDCTDVPVNRSEFERMARYGKAAHQAAVIIGPLPKRKRRVR